MFESEFAVASDVELVAAIEDGVRQEAMAGARRMAAIAELTCRRVGTPDERELWAFDPWDSAAAEVGAAMAVGMRRASGQMRIAEALREHLPLVAALYFKGALTTRMVSAITWGTRLIVDEGVWARVDAAIAERAANWERLSDDKVRVAVDLQVARFDPDAQRRSEQVVRGRDFRIGACDDEAETVSVHGRLLAPAAAVLAKRIAAMLAGLCADDPRTAGERRSDAVAAIAEGNNVLACRCGKPDCPTAGVQQHSDVVVHLIADHHALAAATAEPAAGEATDAAPASDEDDAADEDAAAVAADEAPAPAAEAPATDEPAATAAAPKWRSAGPALLLGRGVASSAVLAEAIRNGATIKPIVMPGAEPETGYRPSPQLAEFVRMRDLFCRFPGCPVSADRCDIDHVRPYPFGPTHPSNLNCKCRHHHLMKTFWTGIGGWSDVQLPDGTVIWTGPSGKTYKTLPGSRLFFPAWDVTTAALPPPQAQPPPDAAGRGLMMPRRKRPRAADIAAAIQAERDLNARDNPPF
ncbi:HNH endonuclease signature motif containing protein [Mycolicibacterium sp. 120270]|uniref:HNH endonuclease signature motif containing protein n=1 Tax=Mycolicibacterium sp. 120270 TaxID=3090600 RepID=UPI00299DFA6C|nr:DUF222 domain-containing protein [Mycolicibacterium sp. 120270]MDX1881826.1 DUF222 domain-containing protein [Mycolicibacterium sp. 120270]